MFFCEKFRVSEWQPLRRVNCAGIPVPATYRFCRLHNSSLFGIVLFISAPLTIESDFHRCVCVKWK